MAGIRFVSIATFYIYRRVLPVDNVSWWWWRYTLLISTLLPGNTVPNCRNLASPHRLPAPPAPTPPLLFVFVNRYHRRHNRLQGSFFFNDETNAPCTTPTTTCRRKSALPLSPSCAFFHALFSLLHLPSSALRVTEEVQLVLNCCHCKRWKSHF